MKAMAFAIKAKNEKAAFFAAPDGIVYRVDFSPSLKQNLAAFRCIQEMSLFSQFWLEFDHNLHI